MRIHTVMLNQTQIFQDGEADQWFARNKAHLNEIEYPNSPCPHEIQSLVNVLSPFKSEINSVLEIGCSSGQKLEYLCHGLDATGRGIDPSAEAVKVGASRLSYSDILLSCGTADALPYESNTFDLVYFGFCMYLFDRSKLLAAVAEADRVLKPGGFLAITDFDPGEKGKRPYSHKSHVFSYKQDYSRCFTDVGLYYLLAKSSFSHARNHFDPIAGERISLSVLYKEKDPYPDML